jgi:hypothetical protein
MVDPIYGRSTTEEPYQFLQLHSIGLDSEAYVLFRIILRILQLFHVDVLNIC